MKSDNKKNYSNYDSLGISPRLHKEVYDFSRQNFLPLQFQVKTLF